MPKLWSAILRILIAAAGITYIALNVNWHDRVQVPAGVALPNGQVLTEAKAFPVVDGDLRQPGESPILLAADDGQGGELTLPVPADRIGSGEADYVLKPGIVATLRDARPGLVLLGLMIVGLTFPTTAVRWWLLMHARGLRVTPWKAFRLTMVGSFFNYCMPGMTGGDLIRVYYAAKGSDRKADAVMSVVADRVLGVLGLITLAGFAGLFMIIFTQPSSIVTYLTGCIWAGAAVLVIGATAYFSRRLREKLGVDQLLARVPAGGLIAKVDEAAVAYGGHKRVLVIGLLMSSVNHLWLATGTACAGYAIGLDAPIGLMFTVVPLLFFAAGVPLTYQGLGVMEGLAIALLLNPPAVTNNHLVGMLLMVRLFQVAFSLGGSVFLLRGDIHLHPQDDGGGASAQASTST